MGGNIRTEWLNRHYYIQKPVVGIAGNCGTIYNRRGPLADKQRDFVDSDLSRCVSDIAQPDELDGFGVTETNFRIKDWNRLKKLWDIASVGIVGLD